MSILNVLITDNDHSHTQKKIMISSCNTNFASCDVFQVLTLNVLFN